MYILWCMPTLKITVGGLGSADTGLQKFARTVDDWRGFWRKLGERLADDTQARWPLRRRTGKLRRSLTWAGDRLGRGGIFQSDPDRLKFGTALFYGRFAQHGTKRQRATHLFTLTNRRTPSCCGPGYRRGRRRLVWRWTDDGTGTRASH